MPHKKKLSKKEKALFEAEQAELLRIEMEKEKLKKLEDALQRRKVEREQAERHLHIEIQQNRLRRSQLKQSMAFFNQIEECSNAIIMAAKEQSDWEKFMRCNGLPNSNSPSDLRKYIHQWQIDVKRRNQESRNWLLKTDERTLLTQDTSIPDLTKATLRKQQENLGDVYAQRVKEVLGILLELEGVLADKYKPQHTLVDLQKLKTEIRVLLKDYLDDFAHKIMSHIERDMECDRPGVSTHVYDSEVLKSFIWTFSKDAQISLSSKPHIGEQNLHNGVDFPLIGMQMSLPPSVSLYSSALRGLWLNYDHFSDYCPSFKLKKPRPNSTNILKQSKREWRKRREILQNMLDEYSKEVPLTELEQFENEQDLILQQAHEKYIDVDKIYLEYEEELSKLRRKAIGPAGLSLFDTDVNLRKYRIIGGVYCADYLETPQQDKQLSARSFIRTIFSPNKLSHKSYYQTFQTPPPPQPGVRRLPEEIEAEMRMVEAALDKLVLVTVKLPDSVIWFEPPIACRWETQIETLESDVTENSTRLIDTSSATAAQASSQATKSNHSPLKVLSPRFPAPKLLKKRSPLFTCSDVPVREVNDFDVLKMPSNIDICSLVKEFVVPRLPLGFSVQINGQRVKQLQQQKRKAGKKWNKPTKLLFLDRSPQSSVTAKRASSDHTKETLEKFSRKHLTEDFLDFYEPKEFFPCIQFNQVLKINPSQQNQKFKLDLKAINTVEENERFETPKSATCGASECTTSSEKSCTTYFGHEDITIRSPNECRENKSEETYMFSQFIEDLDRLRDLEAPKLQEELLEQISVNLKASNTKGICSDTAEGAAVPGGSKGDTQALTNVTQQPATFSFHSGISFIHQSNTLKIGCDEGGENKQNEDDEEPNDEDTSTDESQYDDDYDEYFLIENVDNDKDVAIASNRSEVSGSTGVAGSTASSRREADVNDFLHKDNVCSINKSTGVGNRTQLLNEPIFTQGKWSTRDVHDIKFNEDKLSIQFRTGRLGIFGFALNRYSNMPYQTWEIKPNIKNPDNILFSFTASLISMDVTITSQGFCVNSFQGGSTAAINEMIGKFLSLDAIKQILISSAVDVFPDEDAFCYTEGSCEKNYVMEMHLYACMSTLSLSHNFSWSRWNLLAGSRTAVLLSRELVAGKKVPNHSTLLVTPLKTSIIDCTEVSASFNSQGIAGMEYYADLYQLAQVHAQPSSLEKQRNMDPVLRDNVAAILMAIRPLSFC